MAIVAANGQDPNQQNPNMGGSGMITGTPSMGGAGGGASSAYQAPNPSGTPSGTPNVSQYIAANQGAGQRLAGSIGSNVQNQANQFQQNLNTQQSSLNNQYNPLNQQTQQGQNYTNTAFQNPQDLLAAYQAQQAQANPTPGTTPTAPNQTDLQNYNNFESTVAGTPQYNALQQGITNYQQAGQQAGNTLATQLGALNQTASLGANSLGQNQLLQQTVGTPNYSSGQQALDALFLQGQGNQLQQNLGNIYNTAAGNATNAQTDYQNKLAALQQLSGQNTAYTQNLFLNGLPGQQGQGLNQIAANVGQEASALLKSAPAQQAAIQQAFQTNTFTPQQLQQLGLTQGQQTWGLTPAELEAGGNLQTPNINNLNAQALNAAAASPTEFARYNALNQLAGGGGTGQTAQQSIFGKSTQGGYNPVQFNAQALQNQINQKQQTITGADFTAALQQSLANFNMTPSGRSGAFLGNAPGQPAQGGVEVPFAQNILNQLNAGTLTPTQAYNQIEQENQQLINQYGKENPTFGSYLSPWQSFLNYYGNEYLPASQAEINVNPSQMGGAITGGVPVR